MGKNRKRRLDQMRQNITKLTNQAPASLFLANKFSAIISIRNDWALKRIRLTRSSKIEIFNIINRRPTYLSNQQRFFQELTNNLSMIYLCLILKKLQIFQNSQLMMMGVLAKIRNLFVAIFLFYVLPFIATFLVLIKVQPDGQIAWSKIASKLFKVKYHKLQGSCQQRKGKIIYLVNHRCQADFFIHNIILNANMNVLSRMLVALIFPGFMFTTNTIWFFNRSGNINPQKFNQWLTKKWQQSTRQAILVYPQGHRMHGATKCQKEKIKTGLIRFAYRSQAPVQLVMSFGNQQVFNQKKLHMAWNRDVYYSIGEVIEPKDFETENDFVERAKERFAEYFSEIYEKYQKSVSESVQQSNKNK